MAKRKWLLQRTIKLIDKKIAIELEIIWTYKKMQDKLRKELKKEA